MLRNNWKSLSKAVQSESFTVYCVCEGLACTWPVLITAAKLPPYQCWGSGLKCVDCLDGSQLASEILRPTSWTWDVLRSHESHSDSVSRFLIATICNTPEAYPLIIYVIYVIYCCLFFILMQFHVRGFLLLGTFALELNLLRRNLAVSHGMQFDINQQRGWIYICRASSRTF